jgi:hypothetical protein
LYKKTRWKSSRALSLRAIIWRRRKTQGIARPVPSALHLDFFAAAKPSRLGTARGKVTLLLSLDRRKFEKPAILLRAFLTGLLDSSWRSEKKMTALDGASPALPS